MTVLIGLFIGLAGGLFGGFLGVGGGIIMIPLMTWLAKLSQHKAHGTSLVAIVFTGLVGAVTYYSHGNIDWKVSLVLTLSAVFTARVGARFAHSLPEKKLKKAFGVFLLFVSLLLLVKTYLPRGDFNLTSVTGIVAFLLIGSLTGFVSGMMGVGGGAVMVPLMVVIGGMEQHVAQGTSLLAMVPASISGAAMHYKLKNVEMNIAWGLIGGSLIGSYLGATVATTIPELFLRVVFSIVTVWMGIRYLRA
jgi:hypothetical protein